MCLSPAAAPSAIWHQPIQILQAPGKTAVLVLLSFV
jgi:hypothetical protein